MPKPFMPPIRFLILDFGHPMAKTTIENIKKALLNVLCLMSAYSSNFSFSKIVISSITNGNPVVINNSRSLKKYYKNLLESFKAEDPNINSVKLTVQEYKTDLKNSFYKMIKALPQHSEIFSNETTFLPNDNNVTIQLTVVSKKAATLLNDILKDVINKILEDTAMKFVSKITYQIIHISNENMIETTVKTNQATCCQICNDSMNDLNFFFKNFIFQSKYEQLHLKIIISKSLDLISECDLYDHVIDPALLRLNFHLCNDFMFQVSYKNSLLGQFASVASLEILYRFPLSNLNPTLLFGNTRRVRATKNIFTTSNEFHFNNQIFEALCLNLTQANEGLLSESELQIGSSTLKVYYILIPDGNTLLLNNLAPKELYLPDVSNSSFRCCVDENVFTAMRTSLGQIPTLNNISSGQFLAGLYECLQNQMKSLFQNKIKKNQNKEYGKRRKFSNEHDSKNENFNNCTQSEQKIMKEPDQVAQTSTQMRKAKEKNIHPALLSPKTTHKYRKRDWVSFDLPELSFPST